MVPYVSIFLDYCTYYIIIYLKHKLIIVFSVCNDLISIYAEAIFIQYTFEMLTLEFKL